MTHASSLREKKAMGGAPAEIVQNVRFVYKNLRWLKFDRLCERSGAGQLMINEYLKFIACKVASEDFQALYLACPPEIEEIWHTHVLDTMGYKTMNEAILPPGQFIHHSPDGIYDEDARVQRLNRAHDLYKQCFGNPPAYWRAKTDIQERWSFAWPQDPLARRFLFKEEGINRVLALDIGPKDSMMKVHEMIEDKEGIPPWQQRFIVAYEQLKNCLTSPARIRHKLLKMSVFDLKDKLLRLGECAYGDDHFDLVNRVAEALLEKERKEMRKTKFFSLNLPNGAVILLVLQK